MICVFFDVSMIYGEAQDEGNELLAAIFDHREGRGLSAIPGQYKRCGL